MWSQVSVVTSVGGHKCRTSCSNIDGFHPDGGIIYFKIFTYVSDKLWPKQIRDPRFLFLLSILNVFIYIAGCFFRDYVGLELSADTGLHGSVYPTGYEKR